MAKPAPRWPLIGRDDVVAELEGMLAGNRRCVVLAGMAGVGKTRLASECLAAASRRGHNTLRISANSGLTKLPLGAFAPLLPPMEQVDLTKPQTLQRISRAVISRAQGKPLTILVDDAHLIDEVSAAVVAQLLFYRGVSLIITVRTSSRKPDGIVKLWKDGLAHRIDVGPLSETDVELLVSAALHGDIEATTLRWLVSHSQGNPLYLRELVLGALSAGVLHENDGVWRMRGSLYSDHIMEVILSDRMVDLVEMRQQKLTTAEREALTVVAIGEPLSLPILESIVGFESLQSLETHGMLAVSDGPAPEVRLAHPIYGDVIRARTKPITFGAIYRSLASALEGSGSNSPADLLRIANWRLEGGGDVQADLMLTAAKYARTSGDPQLAERLARAAVDAGAGFDASLLLGQLTWILGHGDEAVRLLAQLSAEATTDAGRAVATSTLMDVLGLGLGRVDEAARAGADAERRISSLANRDEVTVRRSQLMIQIGKTNQAWEIVEPLIARAQGLTLVSVAVTGTTCLTLMGRLDEAAKLAERGAAAHAALDGQLPTIGPHVHVALRAIALVYDGRLNEAQALLETAKSKAVLENHSEALGLFSVELANVFLAQGRPRTAARYAREALSVLSELGAPAFDRVAQLLLVQATAQLRPVGPVEQARQRLDAVDAAPSLAFGADVLRAHAWAAVAIGDMSSATMLLADAVNVARAHGDRMPEIFAWHDLARITGSASDVDRMRMLVREVDSHLAHTMLRHLEGLAADDPRALEAVADEFAEMGADLLAAEALCTAAVFVLRRHGQRRTVAALQRRARVVRLRCEDAVTPALSPVHSQAILARRELEVARLAANGWTNKTIAEHFNVSIRTIENQLQRVYEKLGVAQRSDLGEALSSEPADMATNSH